VYLFVNFFLKWLLYSSVVCCVCSVEAMSLTVLICFSLTSCLTILYVHAVVQVTDCSIRLYTFFTGGYIPIWVVTPTVWLWLWLKYNIAAQPYYCWWNNRTTLPNYVSIIWKEDTLLPAMFNPLCSSTNQKLFKMNFCNESSHYGNYGGFLLQIKAIVCLPQK